MYKNSKTREEKTRSFIMSFLNYFYYVFGKEDNSIVPSFRSLGLEYFAPPCLLPLHCQTVSLLRDYEKGVRCGFHSVDVANRLHVSTYQ